MLCYTVLLTGLCYAAVGGFSVWAYVRIIAPMVFVFLKQDQENYHLIPILGLVLGLFRPDGVIVGFVFGILVLVISISNKPRFRKAFYWTIISALIGGAYFVCKRQVYPVRTYEIDLS